MTPPPSPKRRAPTQGRAQQTVDTLYQAVIQVLEQEGEAALTTNKVARIAGYSIGTLYQYFPSKDALIQSMAQRMQQQVLEHIEHYLADLETREDLSSLDPRALVHDAMRIVVRSMTTFKGHNKSLLRLFWMLESPDQTTGTVKRVAERLTMFFERAQHDDFKTPSATEVFVLTRAVLGVVRCASLEKSPLLGSAQLEDTLCKMAWGLINTAKS